MSLPVATSGPLSGFTSVAIDEDRFADNKQRAYDAHVKYKLGGKDPKCGQGLIDYVGIDCSGFVRTLLMYAAHGGFDALPDGSWVEDSWFSGENFKKGDSTDYMANAGNSDGLLRVAVHKPHGRGGDPIGHIWLLVNGHTVESYGSHGPGERPWDTPLLVSLVDDI